ncbi:ArsR/SmtB family transcription factor [Arvimicrobium flavum]|uniref:ArsR/SmtB family transcription factor n=1 Tax=Arvimicrobium flavum TaxID=3393320 RepID=UPI00237A879D|nr:metalloregulator ArsR/SmtB family transcription factor [Mesorhizobium shangrilense]
MTDTIFRALSDPTRRSVYERLAAAEMTVTEVRVGMAVSQPAISQHLAVLRDAGLITERRQGRFAYYRVAPDALAPLADWVERYRTFWPARVEKLKDVLKEME